MLTHAGITQPVNEWALDYGIYPAVILDRLARGWSAERAITKPMVTAPKQRLDGAHMPGIGRTLKKIVRPVAPRAAREGGRYAHDGRCLTVVEWSAITGIRPCTIRHRLREGWPMHRVLSRGKAGVVANFPLPVGTGGGPTTQEISEIEFSQ